MNNPFYRPLGRLRNAILRKLSAREKLINKICQKIGALPTDGSKGAAVLKTQAWLVTREFSRQVDIYVPIRERWKKR